MRKILIITLSFILNLSLQTLSLAGNKSLIIKAINPGYTINNIKDTGEFIELIKLTQDSILLADYKISYTNSSGKTNLLYQFENRKLVGETLLLRLKNSPSSSSANLNYKLPIAMTSGKIDLFYKDTIVDSVCWGKNPCYKSFSSKSPTTLARNLNSQDSLGSIDFAHLKNYTPSFSSSSLMPISQEPNPAPNPQDNQSQQENPPQCPEGKIYNPSTRRCRNKEPVITPKTCEEGKILNPKTNRCVNIPVLKTVKPCQEGEERDPKTKRCKKIINLTTEKTCKSGYTFNSKTNHCDKNPLKNDGASFPIVPETGTKSINFIAMPSLIIVFLSFLIFLTHLYKSNLISFLDNRAPNFAQKLRRIALRFKTIRLKIKR